MDTELRQRGAYDSGFLLTLVLEIKNLDIRYLFFFVRSLVSSPLILVVWIYLSSHVEPFICTSTLVSSNRKNLSCPASTLDKG